MHKLLSTDKKDEQKFFPNSQASPQHVTLTVSLLPYWVFGANTAQAGLERMMSFC